MRICLKGYVLFCRMSAATVSSQGNRAPRSPRDVAAEPFKRVIPVCCECALHDCRNISEFSGFNKSMEITNWKEAMLLYDSDLIMF